jgi:hypothetical protein
MRMNYATLLEREALQESKDNQPSHLVRARTRGGNRELTGRETLRESAAETGARAMT